ncbi:MAG: HD domain-containing protein [Patescibacteria group bacterium]|jgi:hypothetical protein
MQYNDKVYGRFEINEPIILKLLKLPQMQRLKKVHQNGIYFYFWPKFNTNRFEHSIGVMLLLKRFNAGLAEQVAGLLHDISHQAFSHVIDYFYDNNIKADHQDSIHQDFINDRVIEKILEFEGLSSKKIGNFANWSLLDNDLPNLCADRLDYTLRDSFAAGLASKKLIKQVLNDLSVDKRGFVFNNLAPAKLLGKLSLKMQAEVWHSDWGELSFYLMGEILKHAIDKKIISIEDFWLGDKELLAKLNLIQDPWINSRLNFIKRIRKINLKGSRDDYDLVYPNKFRVINPWVKDKRLTEVDPEFKKNFEASKAKAKIGHYLKFNIGK